jgi:hypothetical protein
LPELIRRYLPIFGRYFVPKRAGSFVKKKMIGVIWTDDQIPFGFGVVIRPVAIDVMNFCPGREPSTERLFRQKYVLKNTPAILEIEHYVPALYRPAGTVIRTLIERYVAVPVPSDVVHIAHPSPTRRPIATFDVTHRHLLF